MATMKDIIKELHFLSDRISTQVRTVAVSLIIVAWGFLLGVSQASPPAAADFRRNVLIAGSLALLAMVSDFLQYFFGYLYTDSLRKEVEKKNPPEGRYVYTDLRYRLRTLFFWLKQAVLGIAVAWLLGTIIPYLFGGG